MSLTEFTILCESGATEAEIMSALSISVGQVKRLKAKWNLQGVAEAARCSMPSLEQLQACWQADPTLTTADVANHAGVNVRALRQHFQRVGFSPHRPVPDDEVLSALREIQQRQWCNNLGQTFAASALWVNYQIIARPRQIQRCLKQLDPQLRTARQAATARMGYVYRVGGPRSLYHCDAHEKLAKVWGFWFHLCIDGYSRFIVYLTATNNKRASTVGHIFVSACNIVDWASRVRWDRGKENAVAIQAQWDYWWDTACTQSENERRGSALTRDGSFHVQCTG
jgi:hypothetical protein